jgi:cell shape-determining protein MreC
MRKYILIVAFLLLSYFKLDINLRYGLLSLLTNPIFFLKNLSYDLKDINTFYLNVEKIRNENLNLKIMLADQNLEIEISKLKKLNQNELERTNNLFTNDDFFTNKVIKVEEIVFYDPNNSSILITNNDKKNEMKVGNLILLGRNLIGIVCGVGENLAEVKLLSNRDLSLNTFVVNSQLIKIKTVTSGDKFDSLIINNLLATETVEEGDTVITSGTNEGIPADLIIGRLDRIDVISSQTFRRSTIKKLYDLNTLKYVGVLKK